MKLKNYKKSKIFANNLSIDIGSQQELIFHQNILIVIVNQKGDIL